MNRLWIEVSENISFGTFSSSPLWFALFQVAFHVDAAAAAVVIVVGADSCGCWLVGVELKINRKRTHLVITLVSTFAIYLILPI